jgi:hypothetical protein
MSDEDRKSQLSVKGVDGGAVIKFIGPDDQTAGVTVPRAATSNNTFIIGDPAGSAILRFLVNGHL